MSSVRRCAAALAVVLSFFSASSFAAGDDCGLEPPGTVVWPGPVPTKSFERERSPADPPLVTREVRVMNEGSSFSGAPTMRPRQGALSGKTVYLSQGHGFTYTATIDRWVTQRGTTQQILEDLVSAESVNQYLVPLLMGAGANVVTVRESDTNARMVIVDNGTPDYKETGAAELFSDSTTKGFGPLGARLLSGTNPFELGTNRLMNAVKGEPTARATWVPEVPASDYYNVYISYSAFTQRVTDAHFVVRHTGGESHFRVNQRSHGSTWVFLGRFYFRAGKNEQLGALVALNDSQGEGNISLDAVRLGGGQGLIPRPAANSPISGRPRFEESSRYHAQFMGAPTTVYDTTLSDRDEDVGTRPRFAAWDHEPGEDAVYVAWHTNAATGNATGTETFAYGNNANDGTFQFAGTAGSDVLGRLVHAEVIKDFRSGWDPNWSDRRLRTAYFGEINPSNNNEMPSILVEIAFHDAPNDAAKLRDPSFRYTATRAIAQGIMRYFLGKDGKPVVLPPEPPAAVWARNTGGGAVEIRWRPTPQDTLDLGGHAATSYRLYQSADGLGWDDGMEINATSATLTLGLGQVRYFRVAAVNAGGESLPSAAVGAQGTSASQAAVLIVNGFDRLDPSLGRTDDLSSYTLGTVYRALHGRMNDGSYVARHGDALKATRVGFDSATYGALGPEGLALSGYAAVDWFAGRGRATGKALTAGEVQALTAYVNGGGHLLFSGGQVLAPLAGGTAEEKAFVAQVLKINAAAAGAGAVSGSAMTPLSELSAMKLDDGLQGAFPAGAEALTPQGSIPAATYDGTAGVAAVTADGSGKRVTLGFPFEALVSEQERGAVMKRVVDYFGLKPVEGADAGTNEPVVLTDGGVVIPGGELPIQLPDGGITKPGGADGLSEAVGAGCHCGSAPSLLLWLAALSVPLIGRRRRSS